MPHHPWTPLQIHAHQEALRRSRLSAAEKDRIRRELRDLAAEVQESHPARASQRPHPEAA